MLFPAAASPLTSFLLLTFTEVEEGVIDVLIPLLDYALVLFLVLGLLVFPLSFGSFYVAVIMGPPRPAPVIP